MKQQRNSNETSSGSPSKQRKPLRSQALGGYWRVPVFALVGALVAFTVSFAFKSEYPSVSRMLIRTGETSYSSTDSAATLGDGINIGGIDITKQQTLGNTLVNLTLSESAAAEVVDRIGVEEINGGEEPSLGPVSKFINFLKVGGTGTAPSAEEAAIDKVQGSLEAVVLDESWIMEITAWDPDPELARQIADVTADVAVDQSSQRFKENSLRELEYLTGQIEAARAGVAQKAQAVADFKSANNIIVDTSGDSLAGALSPSAPSSLDQLNNQLVGLRAREQVIREQLFTTPRTVPVDVPAPDGSTVRQQQPNPDYAATQKALESVQADIAVAEAQFNDLASRLGGGSAPSINEIQVQLSQLQSDLELSQESYKTLNDRYNAVAITVEKPRFDASRLGSATVATTPGRPLRYLFLLVGALVGALAGLLLTWFRSIREEDEELAEDSQQHPDSRPTDAIVDETAIDVRSPAGPSTVTTNGEVHVAPGPMPPTQVPPPAPSSLPQQQQPVPTSQFMQGEAR
jgi:uncharacterized protein involved in exopolysaccharide biosynthesis